MAYDLSNLVVKDQHIARLFYLTKSEKFDGYGFQIHSDQHNSHFVAKVIAGSDTKLAGLQEGYRIIYLNGVNINGRTHDEVMKLIGASADSLRVLVEVESVRKNLAGRDLVWWNLFICCEIQRQAKSDGYGFDVLTSKGKPGHFIGIVDAGSLAEAAGLRTGLRLIEVNGVYVVNESHKHVAKRIWEKPCDVVLLLIDPTVVAVASDFYDSNNIKEHVESLINIERFIMAESMVGAWFDAEPSAENDEKSTLLT